MKFCNLLHTINPKLSENIKARGRVSLSEKYVLGNISQTRWVVRSRRRKGKKNSLSLLFSL